MAIDDMLRALEEEGRLQQTEILDSAKLQAAEIVKTAKGQIAQIESVHTDRVNKIVEDETAKMLTEAKRHVERGVSKVKDKLIEAVFTGALADLKKVRKSADYEGVFRRLAQDAIDRAEGHIEIHIDARDRGLADKVFGASKIDYELKEDIETSGGAIISAEQGRVIIDNTVESRTARAREFMTSLAATRLFGEAADD